MSKAASTIKTDLAAALREDRYDYILSFYLARYAGLRIHECFRIDTAIAEHALRKNAITVKGKGDKVRTVPVNDAIYRVQKFLLDHRKELQDEGGSRSIRIGHKICIPKTEIIRFLSCETSESV